MDSPSYIPYTDRMVDSLSNYSEAELILKIKEWLAEVNPKSPEGIGDDCAVNAHFPLGKKVLTTIDGIHWGVHVDDSVSPENAGRKLLARNLSDIAAMGGDPVQAVLSVSASGNLKLDWLRDFYGGLRDLAREYAVTIVGGDISQTPSDQFHAELCLLGVVEDPILRTGAELEDVIAVTGSLGGSIIEKHFRFTPRIEEGKWLARTGLVSAMMDISDGLGKDLRVLLNNFAAQIDLGTLPVSEAANLIAQKSGKPVIDHVLDDGEDYELLFTIKAGTDLDEFQKRWNDKFDTTISFIGRIMAAENGFGKGKYYDLNGDPILIGKGYEHF